MPLSKFNNLTLPASADFHVHLRDAAMMRAVVPTIRQGGVNTVYVMPNLVPPLTSAHEALAYKARLREVEPNVNYLMTLYLHESITPQVVKGAKAQGIVGVKSCELSFVLLCDGACNFKIVSVMLHTLHSFEVFPGTILYSIVSIMCSEALLSFLDHFIIF